MAVMNPCCCCSLKVGTQIVAIFNLVCSTIGLLYYVTIMVIGAGLVIVVAANSESDRRTTNSGTESALIVIGIIAIIITIILLVAFVVNIVAAILLLIGAGKRNLRKCWLWFYVTTAFLVLYILYKLVILGLIIWASEDSVVGRFIGEIFSLIIAILFEGYQLWVVYAFIHEIKRGDNEGGRNFGGVVYAPAPKVEENQPPAPAYRPPHYPTTGEQPRYASTPVGYPVLPPNDIHLKKETN